MSNSILKIFFSLSVLILCSAFTTPEIHGDHKAEELIKALYKVNGGWKKLASKKDVEFTYIYKDYQKGMDISKERYIFNGEFSWAEYSQHEVNVMPGTDGNVKQCYMKGEAMISLAGKPVTDEKAIGGTAFLRSANYFWFTMMYKLDDPGTVHKYLGKETIDGIDYEKISLSYNANEVKKEVNDEYILYFNPKTALVDQFMFSLPAMGVNQPVLKMMIDYSKIDGVYVPAKRSVLFPDEKGNYAVGLEQITKDVKFNNGFKVTDLGI